MQQINNLFTFFSTLTNFDKENLIVVDENLNPQEIPRSTKQSFSLLQRLSRALVSIEDISKQHSAEVDQSQIHFVKSILTHIQRGTDTTLKRLGSLTLLSKIVYSKPQTDENAWQKVLVESYKKAYLELQYNERKSFSVKVKKAIALVSDLEVQSTKKTKKLELKDIKALPQEVLCHIFSYLPLRSLAQSQLVCTTWHTLASDNQVVSTCIQNLPKYLHFPSRSKRLQETMQRTREFQVSLTSKVLVSLIAPPIKVQEIKPYNDSIIIEGKATRNNHNAILIVNDLTGKEETTIDLEAFGLPEGVTKFHEGELITIDKKNILYFTNIENKERDHKKTITLPIANTLEIDEFIPFKNFFMFYFADKSTLAYDRKDKKFVKLIDNHDQVKISNESENNFGLLNEWLLSIDSGIQYIYPKLTELPYIEELKKHCKKIKIPYSEGLMPLHISHDNFLFCLTKAKNLKVFDLMNEQNPEIGIINCHNQPIKHIKFAAFTNGTVFISDGRNIYAMNAHTSELIQKFRSSWKITQLYCSDKNLYVCTEHGTIFILS